MTETDSWVLHFYIIFGISPQKFSLMSYSILAPFYCCYWSYFIVWVYWGPQVGVDYWKKKKVTWWLNLKFLYKSKTKNDYYGRYSKNKAHNNHKMFSLPLSCVRVTAKWLPRDEEHFSTSRFMINFSTYGMVHYIERSVSFFWKSVPLWFATILRRLLKFEGFQKVLNKTASKNCYLAYDDDDDDVYIIIWDVWKNDQPVHCTHSSVVLETNNVSIWLFLLSDAVPENRLPPVLTSFFHKFIYFTLIDILSNNK